MFYKFSNIFPDGAPYMYFVRILACLFVVVFFMFDFIYFNGFLRTGGGEVCCPSSTSRVVKGKNCSFC